MYKRSPTAWSRSCCSISHEVRFPPGLPPPISRPTPWPRYFCLPPITIFHRTSEQRSSPCHCSSCEQDSPSPSRAVSTPPASVPNASRFLEMGQNHHNHGPVWDQHQQGSPLFSSLRTPVSPSVSPGDCGSPAAAAGPSVMSRKSSISGRSAPARRIVLFGDSAVSREQQPPCEAGPGRTNQSERKRGSDEARGIISVAPPSCQEDTAKNDISSFFGAAAFTAAAASLAAAGARAEAAPSSVINDSPDDSIVRALSANNEETPMRPVDPAVNGTTANPPAAATGTHRDFVFATATATGASGVTFGASGWNPSLPGPKVQLGVNSNVTSADVTSPLSSTESQHPITSIASAAVASAPHHHDRLGAAAALSSFTFCAHAGHSSAAAALIPGAIGKDVANNGIRDSPVTDAVSAAAAGEWKTPEAVTGTFSLGSSGKANGAVGSSRRPRRLRMRVGG